MWTTSVHNPVAPAAQAWGVSRQVAALGAAICAALLGWLLIASSAEDRVVAAVGLCVAVAATLVAFSMRFRLTADRDGLTIRGPGGRRQVRWDEVTAVGAPTRSGRGRSARAVVELELADGRLIVLSGFELAADPLDVAADLRRWRLRGTG